MTRSVICSKWIREASTAGNGLAGPHDAAFDGERILVTNSQSGNGNTVWVWKATDLSPLGSPQVSFGLDGVSGVCSDGLNFWISVAWRISLRASELRRRSVASV